MALEKRADIARTTILVLLILTIVLSVISTWVVVDTINQIKKQYGSMSAVSKGHISVTILPRPGEEGISTNKLTGGVSLDVLPNPSQ